jgi:hypothetical protein
MNKKQRTGFRWRRLLDEKREYAALQLREKPNLSILRMMMDMNRDDEAVHGCLEQLRLYEKSVRESGGEKLAIYNQKLSSPASMAYNGSTHLGRAYCGSMLNWFPRKIVNTIYKESHVELDMVNALPTLIANAFDHVHLEALSVYVRDAAGIFSGFKREFGLSRSSVKKAVLSTICSHPKTTWDYGQGGDMEAVRAYSDHPFIRGLRADLVNISASLREIYPEFYDMVTEKATKDGRLDHVDGMALSLMAQDMEHSVMRTVIDKVGAEVWYFDGALIPISAMANKPWDDFCEEMSDLVRDSLDIKIDFKIKTLNDNSLAWSINPLDMNAENRYESWKLRFEESFMILKNPPKFGRFVNGKIQLLNKVEFQHVTCAEPADFTKQWLVDKNTRTYESMEFCPPPFVLRGEYFNTWDGFAAEALAPIDDQQELAMRIEPYKRHAHLLMGLNDDYTDYFHKLIAFKLQKPGYNWGVMPFIRSTQGVGKDQWFKFISNMVGQKYCLSVTNVSDVMGKSTGMMENKLFVSFSEVSYEDSKQHEEDLKKLITDDQMIVERKYIPSYENRMTSCLVAFSNNFGALRISVDDRRYFPVTASGKYANDPVYHGPFHEYINDTRNQRAVFQWLLSMDISDFHPMKNRPITSTFREMTEQTTPTFDIFLVKRFKDMVDSARNFSDHDLHATGAYMFISARLLWDEFGAVCEEMKLPYMDSKSKIDKYGVRQMSEFNARAEKHKNCTTSAIFAKKRTNKGYKYMVDVEAVLAYLLVLEDGMTAIEEED